MKVKWVILFFKDCGRTKALNDLKYVLKNNMFVNISTNLFSQCMSFTKPTERNSVWSATMWNFPNVPSGPFIPMSS